MGAGPSRSSGYASGRQTLSLYIHCKLGHASNWSPLFEAMGQAGQTVELPGHGQAPDWDPAQDYQAQARDLALASVSAPTHLVGHSYGATVALRMAVDRPDLVRSLTLIEPVFFKAAFISDPAQEKAYFEEITPYRKAMEARDHISAAKAFGNLWGVMPWERLRADQKEYLSKRMPLIEAAAPSIVDDNAGIWPRLPHLDVPVLLLDGDASPDVISAIQNSLERQLPRAERQIIRGVGHMGPITHPALFAKPILAFQERN